MAKVRGIDVHIHPPAEEFEIGEYEYLVGKEFVNRFNPVMKTKMRSISPDKMAEEYKSLNLAGILVGWDTESATGIPALSNDYIAKLVKRYPDIFVGFACVDPWKGEKAVDEIDRAINELGLCGVKFHPIAQRFYPNDYRFYPIWEKCAELKVPVTIHTGQTGWRGGIPGGGGNYLDFARPIPYIDMVAADFPELIIVESHPSFPWQEEALSVCQNKSNVFIDLSGWSPKYFPPMLTQYARTLLQDRCLFGTDFPLMAPERWLNDFEELNFKPEVSEKILVNNVKKILTHSNARDFVDKIFKED
jgi:hypothetical protein